MENIEKSLILDQYATLMGETSYKAIDREDSLDILDATIKRPRMRNLIIVGPAGIGKTQLVDSWALSRKDEISTYELDIESMGGQGEYKFAERIKSLVKEIKALNKTKTNREIAIFIDEIHTLGRQEYSIALEALKPIMAAGQIIIIGATTDEEYREFIEPNTALVERFEKLNIPEVDKATVLKILTNMWEQELPQEEVNTELLKTIIEYGKYKPSQSQPRKAIKMLDDLIGWYRSKGVHLNEALLDKRIYSTIGINPKWRMDIEDVIANAKRRVKGQDFAINQLEGKLHIARSGLNEPKRPMGVFMFLGPTGVGKTELAKALAEGLFGSEDKLKRFDMSEYQLEEDVNRFSHKVSDVANKEPFGIYLFDEIEKANRGVMDLFLQILSDARLTDRFGRQVTFRNAFIIFTTNIGHRDFEEARKANQKISENIKMTKEMLQRADAFRPELVNRIDAFSVFNALDSDVRDAIAEKELEELRERLEEKGIEMNYGERVITYITKEVTSERTTSGGGRDIKRTIVDNINVPIAKAINKYANIVSLDIDVFGRMWVEHKQDKEGNSELGIVRIQTCSSDGVIDTYEGDTEKHILATDDRALHVQEQSSNTMDGESYEDIFTDNTLFNF